MSVEEMNIIFNQHIVRFNTYDKDPYQILFHPNLCFRNEDQFVEGKVFIPCILSQLIFNKEISQNGLMNVIKTKLFPSNSSKEKINRNDDDETKCKLEDSCVSPKPPLKKFKKSYKPDHKTTSDLNFKFGKNQVVFRLRGLLDHEYLVYTRVFMYDNSLSQKVIISDIDGTITKSDVLGHLMPFVGRDWSHKGICEFYTNLNKNNYNILYLTARNYEQAYKTLQYLNSVQQKDFSLPEGPLILSPENLYMAFKREIITGKLKKATQKFSKLLL
jgi:phosphatidate phosphatase LPIN